MIVPVDPPTAVGEPLTVQQLGQRIDEHVERLVAADQFSGVVLVAREGKTIFEKAYALADKEREIPTAMATRFGYASVGKMFTAVAVAQLVEAGKMAYSDPLSTYIPEYPADVADRVTIHHLLTHTSGIVDFFEDYERFETVIDSRNPQHDYLPLFMDESLRFDPGERFEYSNSNLVLLGAVIERVSGESYDEYLRKHVFETAGMSETTPSMEGRNDDTFVRPYTQIGENGEIGSDPRHVATRLVTPVGSAAGGGITTAGDLLKFGEALRGHRLLSPAAASTVLTGNVDYLRPGYRYGYGFVLRRAGADRVVGHSGGAPGVGAEVNLYLDSGYAIIVLSNYELVGEPVAMHIGTLLRLG